MIKNLLEKITAVNYADRDRWNKIKTETINTRYQIVWDASSGLDIYPMVAKALDRVPRSIQLQNAILVMSDYAPDYLDSLKNVYKKLNHGHVRLPVRVKSVYKKLNHGPVQVLRTGPDVFERLEGFDCKVDLDYRNFVGNAFIDQMIPLKLWGDDERDKFRNAYECYNCFHPPVPDDDWHLVYFLFRFSSNAGEVVFPVVFVAAENLLIFEQIFLKYKIPIEIFFAVRVASGFSMSWDYTHDFNRGYLPRAIQKASPALRPRFWGHDQVEELDLPEYFREVGTIESLGNGGCTIFETNWR